MSESSDSSTINYVITIAAVALGWFLGETTGWLKKRWSIRNLKQSLLLEIEDCLSWLTRNQITLEGLIQLSVHKEIGDFGPVEVPTHIYGTHFPEISPNLTRSERTSYNSIHNLIRSFERDSSKLTELTRACKKDISRISEFSGILEAMYHNVSIAIFQIKFHLDNRNNLNVDNFSDGDSRRFNKQIENRIRELCIEANRIGLEELRRKHYVD